MITRYTKTILKFFSMLVKGYKNGLQEQLEASMRSFVAYIEYDPESKLYVGTVPGIPGAHTQGASLDELHEHLKEVLELCLEELADEELETLPRFVGVQQVEVA